MKREFLESLGLEKDVIDKIMAEHGKSVEAQKAKVDDLKTSLDNMKKQLEQRDNDLKQLKKQAEGNEELQTKLADLEKRYKDEKAAYEAKIKETQLNSAIKLAINGKVHDADLVASLLDKNTIELDENGNITKGLDEQLKALQETKSFLFVPETNNQPKITGIKPAEGNPTGDEPEDPFLAGFNSI
ncbi:phage scaffolding protein [Anoxybacteroides amylolyticum]|uniref:Phage minor structural GP20 family protein n=1 Tax=Anoxybacteroides amylolyticum TaxID=294699 RepID=A0A160F7J9_9BACL|nr:phage scaffolding protein [Anoxybacillus amylolyticus]ANB62262.1 phage minor structural GP20 family protein [Anoxybacillus amylolyticus]